MAASEVAGLPVFYGRVGRPKCAEAMTGCADGLAGCADGLVGCADGLVGCADGLVGCADGRRGTARRGRWRKRRRRSACHQTFRTVRYIDGSVATTGAALKRFASTLKMAIFSYNFSLKSEKDVIGMGHCTELRASIEKYVKTIHRVKQILQLAKFLFSCTLAGTHNITLLNV